MGRLDELMLPWSLCPQPKRLRPTVALLNDAEEAAMARLRARLEARFGAEWVERFLANNSTELLYALEHVV